MRKAILFAVVFAVFATGASAEVKTFEKAQVNVTVPDGWKAETSPDGAVMVVKEPKNEMVFRMMALEKGDVKGAFQKASEKLQKEYTEFKCPSDLKPNTVNGMKASSMECTAKRNTAVINVGLLLIETPNQKVLMVVLVADESKLASHKEQMQAVLTSIKPAGK